MSRILLTHSPEAMRNCDALIAAASDCDLIVSYRQSPGETRVFERLPKLVAFLRRAIDIRNVDVGDRACARIPRRFITRGCALDVGRAPDQMPTPAIARRADVIATPHTAGLTLPAIEHQSMENVARARKALLRS